MIPTMIPIYPLRPSFLIHIRARAKRMTPFVESFQVDFQESKLLALAKNQKGRVFGSSCVLSFQPIHGSCCPIFATKWASTSYKWSYKHYKWLYKWVTRVITPISGVITLLITSIATNTDPFCRRHRRFPPSSCDGLR